MSFQGFTQYDFDTFTIAGLDGRMAAIKERIQPKFRELGARLCAELSLLCGSEMFLHIAQHARRKVNAPVDTWLAICPNKRGYKMVPHFQVGLFDDRLFIWLALIYELPNKRAIAERMLERLDRLAAALPDDFQISFDHMKKDALAVSALGRDGWQTALGKFRDVKSVELLLGRVLAADDPVLGEPAGLEALIRDTFAQLLPFYETATQVDLS